MANEREVGMYVKALAESNRQYVIDLAVRDAEIADLKSGIGEIVVGLESYMKCNKGKYFESGWLRQVRDRARELLGE